MVKYADDEEGHKRWLMQWYVAYIWLSIDNRILSYGDFLLDPINQTFQSLDTLL